MSEYDINAESRSRTRIGEGSNGTALFEVIVNRGGDFELCFYNGQEATPTETILNPEDGYRKDYAVRFEHGLTYTLMFNTGVAKSQQPINVTVIYRDGLPLTFSPPE